MRRSFSCLLGTLAASSALIVVPRPASADSTLITPTITLATSRNATYDDRNLVVTGTITGLWPDGHTAALTDQPIEITCASGCQSDLPTQTDANGKFSYTATVTPTDWTVVKIAATDRVAAAASEIILPVLPDPIRINAAVSPNQITTTTNITVNGTLEYENTSGWHPLPMTKVSLSRGSTSLGQIESGSNGAFSTAFSLSPSSTANPQQITLNSLGPDPDWFMYATTTLNVYTPVPTHIDGFTASVDPNAKLTIKGSVTIPTGSVITNRFPLQIQYSSTGKSSWRPLKTLNVNVGTFSTALTAPLRKGYYRAVIAPGLDRSGTISTVRYAGRTITRITKFKLSATRVKHHRNITITGTLQRYSTGWKALSGQRIRIMFRFKNLHGTYLYKTVTTKANGTFTVRFNTWHTAYLYAVYLGASGKYATSAGPKLLTIYY